MLPRFFSRTWPWPGRRARLDRKSAFPRRPGSMALITVFLFFLFTTLGLGLHFLSQAYLKLSAFKKNTLLLETTAENGVKAALGRMLRSLAAGPGPWAISEDYVEDLLSETTSGGVLAAEAAMSTSFPFQVEETAGDQTWRGTTRCSLDRFTDFNSHFLAEYRLVIDGEGRLAGRRPVKAAGLDLGLSLLAGRIPLAYFPFLLSGTAGNGGIADLIETRKLTIAPPRGKDMAPRGLITPRPLIPPDPAPLLAEALKIQLLEPGRLNRAQLRRGLGLPFIDEPIPDGVYLIRNDSGPGGIFVQGDLDRILLAVDGGRQIMEFQSGESVWRLEYYPAAGPAVFHTPTGTETEEHSPAGIVLVNGAVRSLCAAAVVASQQLLPQPEAEIPCLLDGATLTLVSSEEIVIDSNLFHEGVRFAEGIPYLKDKQSQLIVYAGRRDFIDGTETSGRILIGPDAPANVRIQASLTAAGSFEVGGPQKTVIIAGGLQTERLDLHSSRLTIAADERITGNILKPASGPSAAESELVILGLRPLIWREGP